MSIEPEGDAAETHGRAAVAAKVQAWFDEYDVRSVETTGPFVNGNRILIGLKISITPRVGGEPILFEETALYTVDNGRIVEECFFY
ncbi:MAG: hypothetical protein JWQ02_471 [Capsulimonas sp.]|nr:hypothetical protein [Capsulimonas sp.]